MGDRLATVSQDSSVRIYSARDQSLLQTITASVPGGPVGLKWSPDDNYLAFAAGSADQAKITIYNTDDLSVARALPFRPLGPSYAEGTQLRAVDWGPLGEKLVAGGRRRLFGRRIHYRFLFIRTYDVGSSDPSEWGEENNFSWARSRGNRDVTGIDISPDREWTVAATNIGRIDVLDSSAQNSNDWSMFTALTEPDNPTQAVFSHDGTRLAVPDWGNPRIFIYDPKNWSVSHTVDLGTPTGPVTWSPRDQYLAVGDWEQPFNVTILETDTWTTVGTSDQPHVDKIQSIDWLIDGSKLATGSSDDTIRVWGTPFTGPLIPPEIELPFVGKVPTLLLVPAALAGAVVTAAAVTQEGER